MAIDKGTPEIEILGKHGSGFRGSLWTRIVKQVKPVNQWYSKSVIVKTSTFVPG